MAKQVYEHYDRVDSAVVGEKVPVRVSLAGVAASNGADVTGITAEAKGAGLVVSDEAVDLSNQRWTGYVVGAEPGDCQIKLTAITTTELLILRFVNIKIIPEPAASAD